MNFLKYKIQDFTLPLLLSMALLMPTLNVATILYVLPTLAILLYFIFNDRPAFASFFLLAKEYWVIACWALFALSSMMWSPYPQYVLDSWVSAFLIPVLSLMAFFLLASKLSQEFLIRFFYLVVVIFSTLSIVAFFVFDGRVGHYSMFFGTVGYYSSYILIAFVCLVPFLTKQTRVPYYFLLLLCFFFSTQRIVWVLFPFIFVTDFIFVNKKLDVKFVFLFAVVVFLSYLFLKYYQDSRPANAFVSHEKPKNIIAYLLANERLYLWGEWFRRGMENWFVGAGFGRKASLYYFSHGGYWPRQNLNHAHNMFLSTFVQLGLVGLVLQVASYWQLISGVVKKNSKFSFACIVLVLIFAMRHLTDDPEHKRVLMFYCGFVGVLMGAMYQKKSDFN
ncbi:O-antigen ligase family protein [Vogesella indigofera]|uniref:O-antigen ligase family protein n=1 Tax=Vogesella indigofera TaxID=45465 RepID=A0ABT5I6Y5_VOGIN|nr:O-antigen ligase family protein [Vogesella indigofera]MDC7691937.1 O-antigen ligase family protein [Vogesella indigofera]